MHTLFETSARQSILDRLNALQPGAIRQWGKMDPAQMLAHCICGMDAATGDRPTKQLLIGRLLSWVARGDALGEKPFGKNLPTDPSFVISDARDFQAERDRLAAVILRFCEKGPQAAGRQTHAFFGRLSGEEWGVLMYKHLDHHLRQFGA